VTEVNAQGADQLRRLARQLKEAGDRTLARELNKAIRKAVEPLKAELPDSARDTLPSRGGLAERVAQSKIGISRRKQGLRLVAKNKYQLKRMDKGSVRHPVFGNTEVWALQFITPGWFTRRAEEHREAIQDEVVAAMDSVASQIERGTAGGGAP
jgi:hypothetical protein